ncbi:MAG: hypothetical protein U0841_24805 [Chloroflexia bacterium]
MRARDAAVLGGVLAIYDVVATSLLPLTDGLFDRLAGLPLAPLVVWPTGDGGWIGLGLGGLAAGDALPAGDAQGVWAGGGVIGAGVCAGRAQALLALAEGEVVR